MTRAIVCVAAMAALLCGCAADPPTSVVGVEALGCRPAPEFGSGMFVTVPGTDEPLVLTSAHVVAGAREITVRRAGATGTATVVAFDPDMDLAYLAVDGLGTTSPWPIGGLGVDAGDRGVAYVVRHGEATAIPITVARRITIRTEDVYVDGETLRPGFELTAEIQHGDSGGAVAVGGEVIGVVWARSRAADERAYAIDPLRAGERMARQLRTGDLGDVDLTRCS